MLNSGKNKLGEIRFAKVKFLKNHLTTHSDVRQFACEVIHAFCQFFASSKMHVKTLNISLLVFLFQSTISYIVQTYYDQY